MSFDKLLRKVEQAEMALEARERQYSADMRQLKRSWRLTWSPGRIVVAGLLTGFLAGRRERVSASDGTGILRVISLVSTMMASVNAKEASSEAEHAADAATDMAATQAPGAGVSVDGPP
ncbi:MAG: hypothetical protein A2579_10700 [Lysobacterales bacterium RIFOXYD1_FULL_69_11]|nr:MAG: hypothetical protein A2190_14230 [Xanthomonadales bacterium RIFOXYA1_FULL_69_10]OHE87561.1 MAG: hypothetical protein A2579_10700 [Xanthomonadales bacterium RIFOXYD1_FULL_69_11]